MSITTVSFEPAADPARYALLRQLGTGASGSVYLARDAETGGQVALKKLFRLDPKSVQRFKREFRSLADLHHPNLVKIFDLQRGSDAWFLTMEYVEGVEFHSEFIGAQHAPATREPSLEEGSVFDSRELAHLLGIFHGLASGIYALHHAGLLHRDLKPSNVLIAKDGRVVVLDFGLVLDLDHNAPQLTQDGTVAGTPAYMAPEQSLGDTLTEACDWYAFGVMLYEALAGHLPIDERDVRRLLQLKLQRDPEPLEPGELGVPRELTELCMQLLARSPERRPLGKHVLTVLAGLRGEGALRVATPSNALSVYPDTQTLKTKKAALFVGRGGASAQLQAAFERASQGHRVVVGVRAPSGTGKTALVEHFLETELTGSVAIQAPLVLRSRCYEREAMPFKALDGAMDGLIQYLSEQGDLHVAHMLPSGFAELAQLFPALQRLHSAQRLLRDHERHPDANRTRQRAEQSLRELFERVASQRAIVLWIDDVQWGDLDSAGVLREWFVQPSESPLLLILSYRSEELQTSACLHALGPALLNAESEDRRGAIELDALDEDEVRALCRMRLPSDAPQPLITRIVAEARGNPFWTLQLLALAQAKLARRELDLEEISLGELVTRTSSLLSPAARMLLDVLAVAGRPLLPQLALRAANVGQDSRTVIHALQSLRLLRSPVVNGERFLEVYHDRVREAVQSALDPVDSLRLSEQLLRVLELSGRADPDWLHELASGAGDEKLALRYGRLAAERADRMLAFERAIELYQRCLKLTAAKPEQAQLWHKLAQVLAHSRRGAEAAEAYLAAADLVEPVEQLSLWRLAASHLLRTGRFEDGERLVQRVLAAQHVSVPSSAIGIYSAIGWERMRVALLGTLQPQSTVTAPPELVQLGLLYGTLAVETQFYAPLRAALFQARAAWVGVKFGDRLLVARMLCMYATISCLAGTVRAAQRADAHLARAEALLTELDNQDLRSELLAARTVCAWLQGNLPLVLVTSEKANRHYETQRTGGEQGDYYYWFALQSARVGALQFFGHLTQAVSELRQLLTRAESTANLTAVLQATVVRTLCDLSQDRAHEARPRLDREREQLPRNGIGILHVLHLIAVLRAAAHTSQFDWGFQALEQLWQPCLDSPLRHGGVLRYMLHSARARLFLNHFVAQGRKHAPAQEVHDDLRALRAIRHLPMQTVVERLSARVDYLRGDKAKAIDSLRAANESLAKQRLLEEAANHKYALGCIVGGVEGAQLIAAALAESAAIGVVNPLAMLRGTFPELAIDAGL